MHRTFNSGAARRNEITAKRMPGDPLIFWDGDSGLEIHGTSAANQAVIAEVNAKHDTLGRINPILDVFRDHTYQGDPDMGSSAFEFLFQLARHWSGWQSPRIGTFPLDYRDPAGPNDRQYADETGEDSVYWEIDDALARMAGVTGQGEDRWDLRSTGPDDDIQDAIVHATAVLDRILTTHPLP